MPALGAVGGKPCSAGVTHACPTGFRVKCRHRHGNAGVSGLLCTQAARPVSPRRRFQCTAASRRARIGVKISWLSRLPQKTQAQGQRRPMPRACQSPRGERSRRLPKGTATHRVSHPPPARGASRTGKGRFGNHPRGPGARRLPADRLCPSPAGDAERVAAPLPRPRVRPAGGEGGGRG